VFSIAFSGAPVLLTANGPQGTHFSFTGSINPVTVTDTRASAPAWTLSGLTGDFTGLAGSAKYLGWTPTMATPGGGAVLGPVVASGFDSGDGLSVPKELAHGLSGHPPGTAAVGADLNLKLPAGTPGGTYSSILTLTAI
jgi:hypothetical protein